MPKLSARIAQRKPTAIRNASIKFAERKDGCAAINVAIGNVKLPMHPSMVERLKNLDRPDSPFKDGIVCYSSTAGLEETRQAFMNVLQCTGFNVEGLHVQVTDGGSQAMELLTAACCGFDGSSERPLLLVDAAYTNYSSFAHRLGRRTVSFARRLDSSGRFNLPSLHDIEKLIIKENPGALVIIPYDNPTGQLYTHQMMVDFAKLCVKYNLWFISDEAYRELHYVEGVNGAISIWGVTEEEVPGIRGVRVSIETTSKAWNGCGLRVGALVTDNEELHKRLVAENTVNLCTNTIGQWIFGAVAHLNKEEVNAWFAKQRLYYKPLMQNFNRDMRQALPGVIVSRADASLYEVVDFREIVSQKFKADDFVVWCASEGYVIRNGCKTTLLTAPMPEFYNVAEGQENWGRTQLRIAFVETPENLAKVPDLLSSLFREYLRLYPEMAKKRVC
ncbi:MAG: pyridoxal phosphate-dependent aminotransferase [Candidatus Bruticola sp.]